MGVKEYLEEKYPDCKIIYLFESGSRLHGTSTENSDTDYKGIFIPSIESIIRGNAKTEIVEGTSEIDSKNSKDDIDFDLLSFKKFMGLLADGDAGAVDILFSMFSKNNVIIYESEISNFIKDNYKRLITNKHQAFTGYALKQVSLYLVKGERVTALDNTISLIRNIMNDYSKQETCKKMSLLEYNEVSLIDYLMSVLEGEHFKLVDIEGHFYFEILNRKFSCNLQLRNFLNQLLILRGRYGARSAKASEQNGLDFKSFSHAVRAISEAIELMKTGFIQFPLKNASLLLDIKLGKYQDIDELNKMIDEMMETLEEEAKLTLNKSKIDDSFEYEALNFIYKLKEKECSTYVLGE